MNSPRSGAPDLTLSELYRVLRRDLRWVLVAGLVGGVAAYAASFLITPVFKASATLVPMSPRDALGGLSALGVDIQSLGLGGGSGDISPIMYPEIAQSRSVLKSVLADTTDAPSAGKRTTVLEWLGVRGKPALRMERGLKALRQRIGVVIDRRTGTLTISARDRDPVVAAFIANGIAGRLQSILVSMLATHEGENRRFVEDRRNQVRADLSVAEEALQGFRQQNLRIGNSPRLQLEENRYVRAVREQEEVYLTLTREYELAKIKEHRDVPLLVSLDSAEPPVQRFWPRRSLVAIGGLFLGALFVVARGIFLEPARRAGS